MNELIFLIEESEDGGYTARALGEDIFTEAETLDELKDMIKDSIKCHHFERDAVPRIVHLHIVKDEVIAV